jgi:hypothetical protein
MEPSDEPGPDPTAGGSNTAAPPAPGRQAAASASAAEPGRPAQPVRPAPAVLSLGQRRGHRGAPQPSARGQLPHPSPPYRWKVGACWARRGRAGASGGMRRPVRPVLGGEGGREAAARRRRLRIVEQILTGGDAQPASRSLPLGEARPRRSPASLASRRRSGSRCGWGDSNSGPPPEVLPVHGHILALTCGFWQPVVTADARRAPLVAGRACTQRVPLGARHGFHGRRATRWSARRRCRPARESGANRRRARPPAPRAAPRRRPPAPERRR